jgi:hypothetical protein
MYRVSRKTLIQVPRTRSVRALSPFAGTAELTVFPAPIAEIGVSGKGAVMTSTLENVTEKGPEAVG